MEEEAIVQVFVELIINAPRAMPDGGRRGLAQRPRGRGSLRGEDTGCGIEQGDLIRIFEPFSRQADWTGNWPRPRGLLRNHARAWRQDRGRLDGRRRKSFHCHLPGGVRRDLSRGRNSRMQSTAAIRLLIAEDETNLRSVISRELARRGYVVTVAHDGTQAAACLETKSTSSARCADDGNGRSQVLGPRASGCGARGRDVDRQSTVGCCRAMNSERRLVTNRAARCADQLLTKARRKNMREENL